MTRFTLMALLLVFTVPAGAADGVIDDWKSQKLGTKDVPEGWQNGQT